MGVWDQDCKRFVSMLIVSQFVNAEILFLNLLTWGNRSMGDMYLLWKWVLIVLFTLLQRLGHVVPAVRDSARWRDPEAGRARVPSVQGDGTSAHTDHVAQRRTRGQSAISWFFLRDAFLNFCAAANVEFQGIQLVPTPIDFAQSLHALHNARTLCKTLKTASNDSLPVHLNNSQKVDLFLLSFCFCLLSWSIWLHEYKYSSTWLHSAWTAACFSWLTLLLFPHFADACFPLHECSAFFYIKVGMLSFAMICVVDRTSSESSSRAHIIDWIWENRGMREWDEKSDCNFSPIVLCLRASRFPLHLGPLKQADVQNLFLNVVVLSVSVLPGCLINRHVEDQRITLYRTFPFVNTV